MEKTTEYVISTWFIPYLMNADSSALLDDEFAQLQEWEEQLVEKAGLTMFSVVENSFQEFAVCENRRMSVGLRPATRRRR